MSRRPWVDSMPTLNEIITEAVRDFTENGFDSEDRLRFWMERIRSAAVSALVPEGELRTMLTARLGADYLRMVERGGMLAMHRGVARYTVDRLKPNMRAELDRRIMASANLIKLNRQAAIEKTMQRFSGWATSIPAGGSDAVDKAETKANIRKAMGQLPFEERRVIIDQSHKFVASLNEIVAKNGNALAVEWHSHWRQAGYNYRKDHKERDGKIYAMRGNWALEQGLMKKGPAGYYDEITAVGEEVFCRCSARYLYALRDLPDDMITQKGKDALAKIRAAM